MTRMTPSEAFVETLVAQGVTHVFGIVGSAYMDALDLFPAAGIRFVSVAHEQGAGHMADGFSRASRPPRRLHRPERPRHHQFRHRDRRRLLGAQPGGGDHARDRLQHAGPGRLPGDRAAAVLREDHQVPGPLPAAGRASPSCCRAASTTPCSSAARPSSTSRATCSTARPTTRSRSRSASSAAPAGRRAWPRPTELLAEAQVPGDPVGRRRGHVGRRAPRSCGSPSICRRRWSAPTCTTTASRRAIRCWAGPIGYQGSKAAMKLLAQADVVLALGTRLGPFGTLPQHGIEYWPKDAKLIQVDANPRKLGLVKQAAVGICGDARRGGSRPPDTGWRPATAAIAAHGNRDARLAEIKAAEGRVGGRARPTGARPTAARSRRAARCASWRRPCRTNAMVTDRHRQHLLGLQQLPALRAQPPSFFAAMSFGNCGYAYPDRDRRQGRVARPAGDRLCRRRRLGHEPAGDADLPCARTSRWWRSCSTTASGARRRRTRSTSTPTAISAPTSRTRASPASPRRWAPSGITVDHPGEVGDALKRRRRLRPADRARADGDPGAGRPVPPRRAEEADAAAGQVQGLHRRLTVTRTVHDERAGSRELARCHLGVP